MPVLKNYLGNNADKYFKLYFWNIIESEKDLYEGLKFYSMLKEKINKKKSLDHRKGILSIRQLLKRQLNSRYQHSTRFRGLFQYL